jgi:RimJ/RimL family protein N-acetyltransferase
MQTRETPRLILRDFTSDDFEAFYATSNDPVYQQFYTQEETTQAFWQQLFARICAGAAVPDRMTYQLAVCLRQGALIGSCGVRIESRDHRQASFGCAIARPFWGQGLAYEASRDLIDFGFMQLSLHRIYAETISENVRALALAERLGMRPEGTLKQHRFIRGRWWDTAIYAVLETEWPPSDA